MNPSIDVTTDYSYRELYQFLKTSEVPEFVKTADVEELSNTSGLAKTAFAAPEYRAFPIHNQPSVFLANAYFLNKKASLEKLWSKPYVAQVEANIKSAAEIFGVEKECEKYAADLMEKEAAKTAEPKYVYTVKIGEDETPQFPYRTAEDLQKAAEYFVKHMPSYRFEWRRDIATNFVKAAKEMGLDELPDLICKYAGMFYPDLNQVDMQLRYRMGKLGLEGNEKLAYEKVIEDVPNCSSKDEFFKLAETVHLIEKLAGLQHTGVESPLKDPVDAIFTIGVEKVAELVDVVDMHGEKYNLQDLKKVSADIYKEAFGIDIDPSNDTILRDVLPTMPRSDVALFRQLSKAQPVC